MWLNERRSNVFQAGGPDLPTRRATAHVTIDHVTGVRYSSELGHPFQVIDEEVVILCVDHPFVPDGRVASLRYETLL
jgi:hypothetical protein